MAVAEEEDACKSCVSICTVVLLYQYKSANNDTVEEEACKSCVSIGTFGLLYWCKKNKKC